MVRKEHDRLAIHLHTENPDKELTELRKAITAVTTTLVVSDEGVLTLTFQKQLHH